MRFRKRLLLALASVAALAVGGMAYAHANGNVSSLPTWIVAPGALPGTGGGPSGSGTTAPVSLSLQTHTNFQHPGILNQSGKVATVVLNFDDDVVVNLAGIPSCTASFGGNTTIATAWERCGPGADTAPEVNAYLCPPTGTSGNTGKPLPATCGRSSTAPASNFNGCTLIFKKSATQLLIFARTTTIANGTANCATPATNNTGNVTVTLTGTLSNPFPASSDFNTRLTVPGVSALPLPLDDFTAKVQRGGVFRARCQDGNKQLNLQGVFTYSPGGAHNSSPDTVNEPGGSACT